MLRRITTIVAALTLIIGGLGATALLVFAPSTSERLIGDLRLKTQEVRRTLTGGGLPLISLAGPGDLEDLDACTGSFVELPAYSLQGLQPVFAAHNNCSGENILPLDLGDRVQEADGTQWEVTEMRDLKKTWAFNEDLLGMNGEVILQTCYWGRPIMKFVALTQVEEL